MSHTHVRMLVLRAPFWGPTVLLPSGVPACIQSLAMTCVNAQTSSEGRINSKMLRWGGPSSPPECPADALRTKASRGSRVSGVTASVFNNSLTFPEATNLYTGPDFI